MNLIPTRAGSRCPARVFVRVPVLAGMLALVMAVGGVAACASQSTPTEPLSARGVLLQVSQRTFTELESIEIRTEQGEVLTFSIEGDTGLTPGHAREHMSLVEPITVYYRETGNGRIAYSITD